MNVADEKPFKWPDDMHPIEDYYENPDLLKEPGEKLDYGGGFYEYEGIPVRQLAGNHFPEIFDPRVEGYWRPWSLTKLNFDATPISEEEFNELVELKKARTAQL